MKTLFSAVLFILMSVICSAQRLTMFVEHIPQNYTAPKTERFEDVTLLIKGSDFYVSTSRDTLDLDRNPDGFWTDRRTGQRYNVKSPSPVGYRASYLFCPIKPYVGRAQGITLTARTQSL